MALTDESMVMPVAPAYGNNGGFGGFGNDWGWIILLLLFAGGGYGFGGFGGGVGGAYDFPWLINGQAGINANTNAGFRDAMLNDSINSVKDGINAISTQLCNGFASVEQGANARQIANMQTAFNSQSAITEGLNTVAMNLQNCCCENRAGIADLKYTVATENCADRQAVSDGIRDILTATQAQTQAILNQLCNDKIEAKNDTIAQLRSELLYARGQASQDVQTAVIQSGQRALANEVEQYVAPRAIPAYVVQNPNCCTNACGCAI